MNLPPLANLFAFTHRDPEVVDAVAAALREGGEFTEVWRPAPGWVAAAAPLPEGTPDGAAVRQHGLAFAEGREVVVHAPGRGEPEALARVARLAAQQPEQLARLPGDFGFIAFQAHGTATVVRSCGGLVPFYVRTMADYAAIATRQADLARYLPDEPRIDPLVVAIWVSGLCDFPDGRTCLQGVRILPRGGFARLAPGRAPQVGIYWDPRPQRLRLPEPGQAAEHARRLRDLLLAKLARDLHPEGGNLLTLSGGIDSSSLGALAAGTLGRKVWAWSLLPEAEDLFEREMRYIRPLAERFAFARRWEVRLGRETYRQLLRSGPKIAFPVLHPALLALPSVLREAPVRVLFGGELADSVCGSLQTSPDWARHTPAATLLAHPRELPFGLAGSAARWAKHRLLELARRPQLPYRSGLPEYVRAEVREEYREWFARRRRAAAADRRPLRALSLMAEWDGWVTMNWEAASTLGVRRSLPFFHREIIELAFACHPVELVGPGTKKLLKAALRDDVPALNLNRPDKGGWGAHVGNAPLPWDAPLPGALAQVVRPDWAPNPPASLGRYTTHCLARLLVYHENLAARCRERGCAQKSVVRV